MPGITINSKLDTKPVSLGVAEIGRELQSLKTTVTRVAKEMNVSVVGYAKAMRNNAVAAKEVNSTVEDLNETYIKLMDDLEKIANTNIDTKEYADLKKEIISTEKAIERLQAAQLKLKQIGKDVVPTKEYKRYEGQVIKGNQKIEDLEEQRTIARARRDESITERDEYESKLNQNLESLKNYYAQRDKLRAQSNAYIAQAYGIKDGKRVIEDQIKAVEGEYGQLIDSYDEKITEMREKKYLYEKVFTADEMGPHTQSHKYFMGNWTNPEDLQAEIDKLQEMKEAAEEARIAKIAALTTRDTQARTTSAYEKYTDKQKELNAINQEIEAMERVKEENESNFNEASERISQYDKLAIRLGLDIIETQKQIDDIVQKMQELEASGNSETQSEAMRRYQYELQRTTELLQKQQQQKKELEDSGKATIAGRDTKEYGDAISKARYAEEKMREAMGDAQEAIKPLYLQQWEQMATITGKVSDGIARIVNAGMMVGYALQHPFEALERIIPVIGSGIMRVVSYLGNLSRKALDVAISFGRMAASSITSFLSRLATSARKATVQLARLTGAAVVKGLKAIGSAALQASKALLGMGKSTRSSGNSLKQSLTTLIRYTLGIRSLFMLVRRLRSALMEAFQNMAKKVPEVNESMSMLVSSLDRLKNSLATAFQPILTTIAPYLAQFMDMLSNAMTKVGMFFAAITGQEYVYQATKANIDYAKSLDKTSKSSKKATKEAENQLAAFDHLNILQDSSKSDTDTDKNETPTSDFEKVPIESKIKDFANRIKDLFKNGDFFDIGKLFADKLEELIDKIDFTAVGKKIADGINAIVDLINGFFDNFDFIELGKKLGDAFMSMIENIRWYDLGRAITQGIRALIETVWGFVTKIDWGKVGDAIGKFLQGAFDNIPWELLGELLGKLITGVFTAIYTAAENFDWIEAGKRLAKGFSNMVNSIDIDAVYRALSALLKGLLDLVTPILTDVETWKKIARDFGNFLNNLFKDKELWDKLRLALIGGIKSAIAALKEFVATFDWGEAGKQFHDQVFLLIEDFPLNELGGALMDLLKGALKFMNEVFGDQTLFNELGQKLAGFLNTLFSDDEFWTEAGTLAGNIMKDILAFGKGALDGFQADKAADNIKRALRQIPWAEIATETWELMQSFFKQTGSFANVLFADESNSHYDPWKKMYVPDPDTSLGTRIGKKLSDVIGSIEWGTFGSTLSNAVVNLFNTIADFFKETREQGKLQEAFASFINGIDWNEIAVSIVRAAWEAFLTVGATLWQTVVDGMKGNRDATEEYYVTLAAEMQGAMNPIGTSAAEAYYAGFSERLLANDETKEQYKSAINGIIASADLYGGGQSNAERFYNGFIGTVMNNGEVKEEYKAAIEEIYGSVDTFKYGSTDMESFFMGFDEAISRVPTGEGSTFYQLMEAIFENVEDNVMELGSPSKRMKRAGRYVVEGFEQGVEENIGSAETTTNNSFQALFALLSETTQAGLKDIQNNVITAMGETNNDVSTHSDTIGTTVQTHLDAIGQTVHTEVDAVGRTIKAEIEGINKTVESGVSDQKSTTEKGAPEITSPLNEQWLIAKDYINKYTNAMASDVSGGMSSMTADTMAGTTDQREEVYRNWDLIADYIKYSLLDMEHNIQSSMNNIHRIMYDAMNTISSMNWWIVGQNICYGIADGINSCWGWLNTLVWNLANSLFISAKNALGIRSPSKVFRDEVGYMLGAGLAEGIDDSQHTVLGSLTDMANAMVDEMQDTDLTADIDVNENRLLNGLDGALTAFTDNVENSFVRLTQRLQAIADTVTFVTPDIAAGTILPYAVQGDININTSDISTALDKNNEELISVIIQAANNQTSAIVQALMQYSSNNKGTDLTAATNYVIEEINRRTRAMGKSPLLI